MLTTLSIDFESIGGVPSVNGFTAMGASIVQDGVVLESFVEYANFVGYKQDEECLRTFWLANQENKNIYDDMMEKCGKSDKDPYEVVAKFWRWVNEAAAKHKLYDVLPIGDNLPYDVGMLMYFSEHDVQKPFGAYTSWLDVCSFYHGLNKSLLTSSFLTNSTSADIALQFVREKVGDPELQYPVTIHDHNPKNDAISIAIKFHFIQKFLK